MSEKKYMYILLYIYVHDIRQNPLTKPYSM